MGVTDALRHFVVRVEISHATVSRAQIQAVKISGRKEIKQKEEHYAKVSPGGVCSPKGYKNNISGSQ